MRPEAAASAEAAASSSGAYNNDDAGAFSGSNEDARLVKLPSLAWKRVPSKSRPGEFSYLHLPTGLRQTTVPHRDPTDEEMKKFINMQAEPKNSGIGNVALGVKRREAAKPMLKHKATADWQKFAQKKKKRKKNEIADGV